MADRFEINHDGKIVAAKTELCADKEQIVIELFSQYGWSCKQIDKEGSCQTLELTDPNGNTQVLNVYAANLRNESRSPFEKKGQTNLLDNPAKRDKKNTIILGVYVYKENDTAKDAVFVGFPVAERGTNSSMRGAQVNKLLVEAKTKGFVYNKEHNNVGFRAEFVFYYLQNYYALHYEGKRNGTEAEIDLSIESCADDNVVDNEPAFKEWLSKLHKANGEPYSQFTRNQYISAMRAAATEFADELEGYASIFNISDAKVFAQIAAAIKNSDKFDAFNKSRGNGAMSACMGWYQRFLIELSEKPMPIQYTTGLKSDFARNRIIFGAPGTGKSFTLNEEKDKLLKNGGEYERVTFHPDYSYANFVGTYKPVPVTNDNEDSAITYSYVPGPFMRVYVKALLNSRADNPKPYLLVIEEINRANVAAVFGDVFQLLDRDEEEKSQYPIQASEDIKKYLAIELGGTPDQYAEIRIPDNMFIWASMNSADQGVFPMDTAFKRRWDFTYMGIDHGAEKISGKKVVLGKGEHKRLVEWNALREAINEELTKYKINEDKLMGPFFLSKKVVPETGDINQKTFIEAFKNKVIMYLFDDAAKQKRPTLFGGCEDKAKNQYSKICKEFEDKGVFIFCEAISSKFIDKVPEDKEK